MFGIDHILYDGAYTYADAVNAFFLYSFCGWVMECIVIRREKGVWENRGFVHLPLCIIYGFGAMAAAAHDQQLSADLRVRRPAGHGF